MIEVHTEVEPPGLDLDEDDGEPRIGVHCGLIEADQTRRAGYAAVAPDADDDTIATVMIAAMVGAAAMRGPGLLDALRRQMRGGL